MLGLDLLDVAIGMIFIFLMLSLVCSAVVEMLEAWLKHRAADLEGGIRELLRDKDGTGLVTQLYNHPLVSGLFNGEYKPDAIRQGIFRRTNLPSYIPARSFALALMDVALPATESQPSGAAGADSAAASAAAAIAAAATAPAAANRPLTPLRNAIANKEELSKVSGALLALVDVSGDDISKARENIENWYNTSMDRVSGWYKRRTKKILVFMGFGIAILMNVNAVTVADRLMQDSTLRAAIVARAESKAQQSAVTATTSTSLEESVAGVKKLGLPIGWTGVQVRSPESLRDFLNLVILPLFGWSITAFAISFGAPFWFDLLNKFMVIRSTVKPHEKSLEEESED